MLWPGSTYSKTMLLTWKTSIWVSASGILSSSRTSVSRSRCAHMQSNCPPTTNSRTTLDRRVPLSPRELRTDSYASLENKQAAWPPARVSHYQGKGLPSPAHCPARFILELHRTDRRRRPHLPPSLSYRPTGCDVERGRKPEPRPSLRSHRRRPCTVVPGDPAIHREEGPGGCPRRRTTRPGGLGGLE